MMEELKSKHRKELRDLQSQVTQKKKGATKKTRKTVNDECDRLEQELKSRHAVELAALDGSAQAEGDADDSDLLANIVSATTDTTNLEETLNNVALSDQQDNFLNSTARETSQARRPNRQKARLARRAAAQEDAVAEAIKEAASLPDLRKKEREKLLEEFEKRNLVEKVVAANGHCLYSSIADQLHQLGFDLKTREKLDSQPVGGAMLEKELQQNDYKLIRQAAADYIANHPNDFEAFLEEPLDGYLHKIRDTGEWGGQLELMALSKTYGINIKVLQADGRVEEFESNEVETPDEAWLAYYRHGFGLGEHYNSLRN